MIRSYVALGSNVADPINQVRQAMAALAALPCSRLVACSSLYRSPPMGPQNQADYINAVVALDTTLVPLLLLEALQALERRQGRQRTDQRWGPRTLDLDLLLHGKSQLQSPRLTLPHQGLTLRPFVLYPLAEIAPALILPDGTPVNLLLPKSSAQDLTLVAAAVDIL